MTSWEETTIGGRESVRDVLFDSERRLAAVGVPSPSVDAGEIVAYVMGTTRSRLFLSDAMTSEQRVQVEKLLARRLARVPLQHLLGTAAFRRIEVAVGPGVFIPRPETELVTEAGLRDLLERPAGERIAVDLCAGSGAIAISLAIEAPGSRVHAVELSDDAIGWTKRNAETFADTIAERGSRLTVLHDDATTVADESHPLAGLVGTVSVVVTNPPYIPEQMIPREPEVRDHEPSMALYGGADGLDVVRGVVRAAGILLRPGGLLVVEHADVQGTKAGDRGVPGVVAAHGGFTDVVDRIDLNGLPRFTMARRAGA